MTFRIENDEARREIRYQVGGTLLNFYPKFNGLNALIVGDVTYTLHDPSGAEIGSGTLSLGSGVFNVVDPNPPNTPLYSGVNIPVTAGQSLP